MKRSHLFGAVLGFFALTVCTISIAVEKANSEVGVRADLTPYTLNVNSAVFNQSSLTTTYQQQVTQNFGGDNPVLNYFLAKKDSNNNLVLAPAGRLFNYSSSASYKGRVTNMLSLTVNYSGGTLYVQEGIGGNATQYGAKTQLTSGVAHSFSSQPNFIMVSNSVAATTITSMSISYSCAEAGFTVDRLGEKYNGKGADGNVYTVVRDGNNVSVNDGAMTGTISVDGGGNFTMTLASGAVVYSGSVSSDFRTLSFSGKSGAGADSAPSILEMNRVYVLDDFESYSQRGTGFTADQTSIFAVSDLRGAYYVDAGSGSGATWVSGSGFKIPSTANYLNLSESGTGPVHSGSKAMLLQGQKAGWVRLWNSEVFNQNQHYNFGRGNKLSFWVHSARNNATGTGSNSSNVTIRAQAYYQNFVLTDSTRNSTTYGTGTKDFTIASGSEWNQCTINLDPTKTVYAVDIMINNSGLATDYVFMPIDDIEVYTEPVYELPKTYEQTETKFTKSYHGSVNLSVLGTNYTFTVKVGLGANGYVYASAGADMEATSYEVNGNQIVIHTEGSYSGKTFGDWTGTLSNNKDTITINKSNITGSITEYMTSSSIVLNVDTIIADGSEGSLETLETKVKRQYQSGSWIDDPGNSNRFTFKSDYYIQGNNSLGVRAYSGGNMRVILNPDYAATLDPIDSVSFWFYVPSGVSYGISIFTYKEATPSSASGHYAQQWTKTYDGSKEAEAGWQYINMGLNTAGGYGRNFSIFVSTNSAATTLDYITIF